MRRLSPEEMKTVYPKVFTQCYGYWDANQLPEIVLVDEHNGEVVCFFSGYLRDGKEIYIQYQGVPPHLRGQGIGTRGVINILDYLARKTSIEYLSCLIENTNTQEIVILTKRGFTIYGLVIGKNGKVLLNMGVPIAKTEEK
jgi:ribosomal protein S18 acetylase RimI-like enzyme